MIDVVRFAARPRHGGREQSGARSRPAGASFDNGKQRSPLKRRPLCRLRRSQLYPRRSLERRSPPQPETPHFHATGWTPCADHDRFAVKVPSARIPGSEGISPSHEGKMPLVPGKPAPPRGNSHAAGWSARPCGFAVKVPRVQDERDSASPGCVSPADGAGRSAGRWLFGLPRFMARWRPCPERMAFRTVAALACRHRRAAARRRAILSSCGVDANAPTMIVLADGLDWLKAPTRRSAGVCRTRS